MNMKEGVDYRILSDGRWLFTRSYLLGRGFCCGSGCVECPYDYAAVPEARRVELISQRRSVMTQGLQDQFAPKSICFGCGPANEKGLKIQSIPDGEFVVARWMPQPHHEAFPGMLNGGIIGALLDCHSNWTAAYHLMKQEGLDSPPCTVTADYSIQLKRPTPTSGPVELKAWVVESKSDRAVIEATLTAGGKITATCRGTFVQVQPGHPAYHRW